MTQHLPGWPHSEHKKDSYSCCRVILHSVCGAQKERTTYIWCMRCGTTLERGVGLQCQACPTCFPLQIAVNDTKLTRAPSRDT